MAIGWDHLSFVGDEHDTIELRRDEIDNMAELEAIFAANDEVAAGVDPFEAEEHASTQEEIAPDITQVFRLPSPRQEVALETKPVVDPDADTIRLPLFNMRDAYYMARNEGRQATGRLTYIQIEGLNHEVAFNTETTDLEAIEKTSEGLAAIIKRQVVLNHKAVFTNWLDEALLTIPDGVQVLRDAHRLADELEAEDAARNLDKIKNFTDNSKFYGFQLYLEAHPEDSAIINDQTLAPSVRVAKCSQLWHDREVRRQSYHYYADQHLLPVKFGSDMSTFRQKMLLNEMYFELAQRNKEQPVRDEADNSEATQVLSLAELSETLADEADVIEPETADEPEEVVTSTISEVQTASAEAYVIANPKEIHQSMERGENPIVRLRRVRSKVAEMVPRKAVLTPEQKAQQAALEGGRALFVLCLANEYSVQLDQPISSMSLEALQAGLETHKMIVDKKLAANLQAIESGDKFPHQPLAEYLLGIKKDSLGTYQNLCKAYDITINGKHNG